MKQQVRTVFVPVDFSSASEEATRYAVSLAAALGAARLDVGHVHQAPAVHLPDGTYYADAASAEQLQSNARRQLEQLAQRHSQHDGLRVTSALCFGLPVHQAILDRAREIEADLIVLSTAGRGGVARALLGSVAEKVVRLSHVPVCTVRAS